MKKEKIKFIKRFDNNLRCRGFQYEIGKEYKIENKGELELCSNTVFHFCKTLQQVASYYGVASNNRFCEIEVLGDLVQDKNKCGSNHIKIVREIKGKELNLLLGKTNNNSGVFNSGISNSGNYNSGDDNSGNHNAGISNSGSCNSGDDNSGNNNSGSLNSGNWNSGSCNSGDFNKCDNSNGFFNTKDSTVKIFNIESDMTYQQFVYSKYNSALNSVYFTLTEWVKYTEEEKAESLIRECMGGYLKTYTYEEACKNWWNRMTKENKEIVMDIPNFDKDVFKEITGIDVDEKNK